MLQKHSQTEYTIFLDVMNCKNVSNVGNLHKHLNLFKPIYDQSQTLLTP